MHVFLGLDSRGMSLLSQIYDQLAYIQHLQGSVRIRVSLLLLLDLRCTENPVCNKEGNHLVQFLLADVEFGV